MITGSLIRNMRKKKKLTQQEVASQCNISVATLSNIETGKNVKIKDHVLNSLINILDIDKTNLQNQKADCLDMKRTLKNHLIRSSINIEQLNEYHDDPHLDIEQKLELLQKYNDLKEFKIAKELIKSIKKHAQDKENLIKCHIEESKMHIHNKKYLTGYNVLKKIEDIAESIEEDIELKIRFKYNMILCEEKIGILANHLNDIDSLISLAQSINHYRYLTMLLIKKAIYLLNSQEYKLSINTFFDALNKAYNIDDKQLISKIWHNLGYILYENSEKHDALKCFKVAKEIKQMINDRAELLRTEIFIIELDENVINKKQNYLDLKNECMRLNLIEDYFTIVDKLISFESNDQNKLSFYIKAIKELDEKICDERSIPIYIEISKRTRVLDPRTSYEYFIKALELRDKYEIKIPIQL
ncbi:helix-turn-helix transcriptional regulator [Virgibacillus sp. YIM 98842]|uniref:helix-turn-helix domain-containing protein n=1 Tax=Virgibacillus sp. YIM 98842 TaxID=2663533 RepID=UPI0013DC3D96|nr:helix-turn-helix transcriptional regulator [Virgibacillus sp. YIM 98842]